MPQADEMALARGAATEAEAITVEMEDGRIEYERRHSDLELEPVVSEDEDYESAPPDYQINTYPADFTLEVLHNKLKAGEIEITDFQRSFVWKPVQSSKLIESFLVGLPVPAVFLYNERRSQKFFVIDGQQRLKSIAYFFEGSFGRETHGKRSVFRLVGLSPLSPYHQKAFDELPEEDQRKLKNAVLRCFIVNQLDPLDDTSMYHIFGRLNTGGTLLSNQEIRNCIFHGRFISFLAELNRCSAWRRILGKAEPDTRKKDIELLVRFFALRDVASYRKPMKDFLSQFMRRNRDASEERLESARNVFERTCAAVIAALGDKPFHVRAGLNAAVFDAVMTAFSRHLEAISTDIKERYARLNEDRDFKANTQRATTDDDSVRQRIAQADTVLFG